MSVFDRFKNQPNMMDDVQRIRENPSEIGEMLLSNGRINQEQYQQIKGMNNPKDICIYLMKQNPMFNRTMNMLSNLARVKK